MSWDVTPLKRALRPGGRSSGLIKGEVSTEPGDGLYPGFSASGQDVWLERAQFSGSGLILSAVGARCGKVFESKADKWGTVANTVVLLPRPGYDPHFLWYLVNDEDFWEKGGAAQPYVRVAETLERRLPLPPSDHQRAIADYLDAETARIDALLEKKRRMVELLGERRQAVITAATHGDRFRDQGAGGGDPGAVGRGDGVSEWPTPALRRLFRIVNGGTPTADPTNWGGDVPWATPVDLAAVNGGALLDTERTITQSGLRTGSSTVPPGSLLLSTRAPIGYVASVRRSTAFNQGCRGLVARLPMDLRFHRYQLLALTPVLQAQGQGSTFVELSSEALGAIRLASPPIQLQRSIANYLDTETARIDALIGKIGHQLAVLAERRQALITAAVTGELAIPGVAA